SSTVGSYTMQATLNAALENETHLAGVSDNTQATAQNLDASAVSLGGTASRLAVLGRADSPVTPDFYAFTLAAGDTATVALQSLTGGAVEVRLVNSAGQTLAQGIAGATNLTRRINNFSATAADTYFLSVTGATNTDYNLVVTRNADFDTEGNNTTAVAQSLLSQQAATGEQRALGFVEPGTAGTIITFTELSPRPVDGVSLNGVPSVFRIGGPHPPDPTFGGTGPGPPRYPPPPQLEGNAAGILTLDFDTATPVLNFGVVLSTTVTVPSAVVVQLF